MELSAAAEVLDRGVSTSVRWRAKNAEDQDFGRSSGGFFIKLHAAVLNENCAGTLYLTVDESLSLESVLEAAVLDRECNADRIRDAFSLGRYCGYNSTSSHALRGDCFA